MDKLRSTNIFDYYVAPGSTSKIAIYSKFIDNSYIETTIPEVKMANNVIVDNLTPTLVDMSGNANSTYQSKKNNTWIYVVIGIVLVLGTLYLIYYIKEEEKKIKNKF